MNITATICDIKHFSVHDGPGIRTSLFFKGCPLHCQWCHNPESIEKKAELGVFPDKCSLCASCAAICHCHKTIDGKHEFDRKSCTACGKCVDVCLFDALSLYGRKITVKEALEKILEDRDFYAESNGGLTVSGGEPLMQTDFSVELFKILKKESIHTAVDTCGQVPWSSFEKIIPWTDIFLFDFKHADSLRHKELTGSGNELIKDNLLKLSLTGKPIEIRMPLIPSLNDDDAALDEAGFFLKNIKNITALRLLPYHAMAHSKYKAIDRVDTLPDSPSPNSEDLEHAASILRHHGLNLVY